MAVAAGTMAVAVTTPVVVVPAIEIAIVAGFPWRQAIANTFAGLANEGELTEGLGGLLAALRASD